MEKISHVFSDEESAKDFNEVLLTLLKILLKEENE